MSQAKITFYKINRCGYFKHGQKKPNFGDIKDILVGLEGWVTGPPKNKNKNKKKKPVMDTGINQTYCLDILKSPTNDDYILTIWNGDPSLKGKVASINASEAVGSAHVSFAKLPRGNIPGYATYFWFIPPKNAFAAILFHHTLNGHENLVTYIRGFMEKFTTYVVWNDADSDNTDISIAGYSGIPGGEPLNLNPRFETSLYRKPTAIRNLKKNCKNIRKIIRKDTIRIAPARRLALWRKILIPLGIKDPLKLQEDMKIRYEIPYTPSVKELEKIIEVREQNQGTKWNDIGFQFVKEKGKVWLSNTVAKDTIELEVEMRDAEVVETQSLLEAVSAKRHMILQQLS